MSRSEIKIAFIGSHSTGKTSVAEPLACKLGIPFLSEIAREVARNWGYTPATIPQDQVVHYQWKLLEKQIAREQQSFEWISDRSTIDNYAYWKAYAEDKTSHLVRNLYKWKAQNNTVHYSHLILIPPMFPPIDDGERHTDPVEQQRIHGIICNLLEEWKLYPKVYTVTKLKIEDRISEVMEFINEAYARKAN